MGGGKCCGLSAEGELLLLSHCSPEPPQLLAPQASLSPICPVSNLGKQLVTPSSSCGEQWCRQPLKRVLQPLIELHDNTIQQLSK